MTAIDEDLIRSALKRRDCGAVVNVQRVGSPYTPRVRCDAYFCGVTVTAFGDTVAESLSRVAAAIGLRDDGTDPADEVERLMRIIDGGPPPSDEEIEAHADSGGAWRAADNSSSIEIKARDVWGAQGVREADAAIGRVRRWWSLDEQRRPRERIVTFGGDR
jgi:hypothetical protein